MVRLFAAALCLVGLSACGASDAPPAAVQEAAPAPAAAEADPSADAITLSTDRIDPAAAGTETDLTLSLPSEPVETAEGEDIRLSLEPAEAP